MLPGRGSFVIKAKGKKRRGSGMVLERPHRCLGSGRGSDTEINPPRHNVFPLCFQCHANAFATRNVYIIRLFCLVRLLSGLLHRIRMGLYPNAGGLKQSTLCGLGQHLRHWRSIAPATRLRRAADRVLFLLSSPADRLVRPLPFPCRHRWAPGWGGCVRVWLAYYRLEVAAPCKIQHVCP